MKIIEYQNIVSEVAKLCIEANYNLGDDIEAALKEASYKEVSGYGVSVLEKLVENSRIAREKKIAICQDTGMTVVFISIGQEVYIAGGSLRNAINEGVARGYEEGYLRKSVVGDPFIRTNTGDNTPAIIHFDIVEGDKLKICVAPKGFGSENMSAVRMLMPSDGIEGFKEFILETVEKAGPNPCPPVIVGAAAGGTMEMAAILSKKALLRKVGVKSHIPYISNMENELLERINKTGTGPAGFGGVITALSVNIEVYPTHIAGLPAAVNIGCHATRHSEIEL